MVEITTYKGLEDYIEAFRKKNINLLIIVSRGGLGKTYTVEKALMPEAPLIFTGHVTPLSMYKEVYFVTQIDKECFVVFDDVDTLVMNKTNVSLLKQICDTRPEKMVKYSSTSSRLGEVPRHFETSCKTILLTNTLNPREPNLKALMSRGHLINFNPSNKEILDKLKTWGTDKKVLGFFENFCYFAKGFNMRTYAKAEELRKSNLIGWESLIFQELQIEPRLLEIHNLLKEHDNDADRIKHYSASATDYYLKKKIYLKHTEDAKNSQTPQES